MLPWLSFAFIAVAVFIGRQLHLRFAKNRLDSFTDRRRDTSRIVSRAILVDGTRRSDVALALTQSTLFYENGELQSSIELRWIREIEYGAALSNGDTLAGGEVLRLRSNSATFEFILPADVVGRWYLFLPPRRMREAGPQDTPSLEAMNELKVAQ